MMKTRLQMLSTFSLLLLGGCAYSVHDVYVSGFEPYSAKSDGMVVSSHSEQFVILGFKGNTDYLEKARDELEEQCPKGDIVGVVTEYQTALGFLSWNNHIYMKGLCTNGSASPGGKGKKQAAADQGVEAVETF